MGWTVLLALVLVLGVFAYTMARVLNAGSGYAAKNICSGHFLSGFAPEVMIDQALIGASPLLANVSFQIEPGPQRVLTRLYGLFPRVAQFRAGIGCVLLPAGRAAETAPAVQPLQVQRPSTQENWPAAAASPSAHAQLSKILDAAFAEPVDGDPRHTKAVVIVHRGRLVAERYADGVDSSTPLIGWSMTKSVTNLLVGLLVKDGLLDISLPAPVPAWRAQPADPRQLITVADLLQMSSGLAFDEEYGLYSDVTRMLSSESDMAAFSAGKPLAAAVGEAWSYASGTSNILAGIVRRLLGGRTQDVYEFAQERLFLPIGVRTATMEVDASGTFVGSSYMYASARDWARIGLLCLGNGMWGSEQILPPDWMGYSTTAAPANPANNYGAHFWLNRDPAEKESSRAFPQLPTDTFAMDGYQGQLLVMVPSEQLVVVRLGFTPGGNHGVEALVAGAIDALAASNIHD